MKLPATLPLIHWRFFLEDFRASESNLKTRNQVISSPRDEISRRRELREDESCKLKNKPINLRSVEFQLCYVSGI